MANIGLSFSPTQQNPAQPNASPAISPVQDAIRILSFRLPTVLGAGAVTPMQNLGGPNPLGTHIGSSVIENWLKQLFGGGGAAGMAPSSSYDSLFGSGGQSGIAPPSMPPSLPNPSIVLGPPPSATTPIAPPDTTTPPAPTPIPNPFPSMGGGIGSQY